MPDPIDLRGRCAVPRTALCAIAGGAALAASLLGCGVEPEPPLTTGVRPPPRAAVAVLRPTEGNDVRGTVRFEAAAGGVRVESEVSGLSPGRHGYHVHRFGDCSAAGGSSAGPHFDFLGPSEEPPDRITGNLGELDAGADGRAHHEAIVPEARLAGPDSIAGRGVVVHARGNDPDSPPDGAAGARVACGVIGIIEETGEGS